MEPKKNPKYDVHRQRGTFFSIGLSISLLIVITAFQWRVPVSQPTVCNLPLMVQSNWSEDYVRSTSFKSAEPAKARELKPKPIDPTIFVEVSNTTPDQPTAPIAIDQGNPIALTTPFGPIEIDNEKPNDTVFTVVEKMPEPIGGYESFYKTLSENMKYPRLASRNNITGKVFVSFTVNEKSELVDFVILKGIGNGCDEEAMRVIKLSKWNAGKQRGRPVKVKMVQTISFRMD